MYGVFHLQCSQSSCRPTILGNNRGLAHFGNWIFIDLMDRRSLLVMAYFFFCLKPQHPHYGDAGAQPEFNVVKLPGGLESPVWGSQWPDH